MGTGAAFPPTGWRAGGYCVLIPAYEPDFTLVDLVDDLVTRAVDDPDFVGAIVVDDGSVRPVARAALDRLAERPDVTVLRHEVNKGKGAALKTGFDYIRRHAPDVGSVVTADADGQHAAADILGVAHAAASTGHAAIGCRTFSKDTPLRSRFGNLLTALLFRFVTGERILDTQSGLRAYPRGYLDSLVAIPASRYDFEFHALFRMVGGHAGAIEQIPIRTIYEPGNPTSHFSPLLDSARIYFVFVRYMFVSWIATIVDVLAFTILTTFGIPTLAALIGARATAAPIYFLGMRNIAFRSQGRMSAQIAGTAALMAIHITFLWRFIDYVAHRFGVHPTAAMILGVATFYVLNFLAQRYVIYRR